MAKSVLPPFGDFFVPTVRALKARGGSATIEEMEEDVAALMNLSDAARTEPHGDTGRTQFQYELAWVRTYLKKVDAATNSARGVWSLTDKGEALSDDAIRAVRQEVVGQRKKKPSAIGAKADDLASTDDAEDPDWRDRLLAVVGAMEPAAFERLCQRILRESGFTKVDVTGRSGDGGIDGFGVLRMNLVSFHVLFQCKRWRSSVGSGVVRDFRGAMVGRADKGLIINHHRELHPRRPQGGEPRRGAGDRSRRRRDVVRPVEGSEARRDGRTGREDLGRRGILRGGVRIGGGDRREFGRFPGSRLRAGSGGDPGARLVRGTAARTARPDGGHSAHPPGAAARYAGSGGRNRPPAGRSWTMQGSKTALNRVLRTLSDCFGGKSGARKGIEFAY